MQRKRLQGSFLKRLLALLFVSFLITTSILAQQRTITGTVKDDAGELLVGVNIVIKGTTIGTATDIDGSYSIQVNNDTEALSVFYIGYLSQVISINGKSIINVVLEKDVQDIDEVVVIGYGAQKKKLVTGATSQVDGDVLEKRNSTNALQAMQGQVAGVY